LKIDTDYLRQHYAELSDEALLDIDRSELVEAARGCYDEEVARRRAWGKTGAAAEAKQAPEAAEEQGEPDDGAEPKWLESAACACSYVQTPSHSAEMSASNAVAALQAAGIPCQVVARTMTEGEDELERELYSVMVPGGRNLEAVSVLDRDLFNPELETEWRSHLEALSDAELHALDPELICAGFLDRAARLKKVYTDELARRAGK
jgi:hypothetical protein